MGSDASDQRIQRGFDESYGFLSGNRCFLPLENPFVDTTWQHNAERVKFKGYMTDVMGDQSVKFAEQSGDIPFYIYLTYIVFQPPLMEVKAEDLEKF